MRPLQSAYKRSLEAATARYEEAVDEARQYLEERGIARASSDAARLGVVRDPIPGHESYVGRLTIPYIGHDGSILNMRFRSLDGSEPKYLGLTGGTRLYGIRSIHSAGESIHITEGELDRIILVQCGLYAVGVPGAKAWKNHYPRCFAGFSTTYVWGDGDAAGRDFVKTISESLLSARSVMMGPGEDVNDLFLAKGQDGILEAFSE